MPVYQVAVKQTLLLQQLRNIFYYESTDVIGASQIQELADSIRADYVANNVDDIMCDDWQLYGIDVRRVDEPGYLGTDWGFTSGSLTGIVTADPLPTQIALLVLGVGITQRPNRVRSYFGGFGEGSIGATGTFSVGAMATMLDLVDDMQVHTVTGDSLTRVSVKWAVPDATHVTDWNTLNSYEAKSVPATQRRRRIGVGI